MSSLSIGAEKNRLGCTDLTHIVRGRQTNFGFLTISLLVLLLFTHETTGTTVRQERTIIKSSQAQIHNDNAQGWHEGPSALVSDDCDENNAKVPIQNDKYEEKDMEFREKNVQMDKKTDAHESDVLLVNSVEVSHVHAKDKGRRAISESKARKSNTGRKTYEKADEDYVVNITFGTQKPERDSRTFSAVEHYHNTTAVSEEEQPGAWRGRYKETGLRFRPGPTPEKYMVPMLKITDGVFVFGFLSGFFGFLHPFEFPTELLRDVMWNMLSVPQLILQSIRVEVGFIIAIILSIIVSLIVPVYGFVYVILGLIGKKKYKSESATPPPGMLDDEDYGGACERRMFMLLMQIFLIISLFGIGIMIVGNEFASGGAALTGKAMKAAGRDLSAYFQATHRELSHVLIDSADQAISAVEHDLENIDVLLGEPIQKALAAETGLDVALDALNDITSVSLEMSIKVQALGLEGTRATTLASNGKDRLKELRRQLDAARTNCAPRDRPLCETIDTSSLDIIIRFETITEDQLEALVVALNAQNLSDATSIGKEHFLSIPNAVSNQTKTIVEDVREALAEKRTEMRAAERSLAKVVRHLTAVTTSNMRYAEEVIRAIDTFEFWRWILFLVAILLMSTTILLMLIAVCCGCCGAERHASCLLKSSAILMCFLALPMWSLVIVVFAAGGHGEVFLCRPLYDEPEYKVLGKLLDKPGLLYKENTGFFNEIFKEVDSYTLDKPVRSILNECKENKPAYPVFNLRKIFDLNVETAHWNWSRLETARVKFSNSPLILGVSTPASQMALSDIMKHTNKNFTDYRLQLNGPLTGKDLTSLADQLESIANQITDLSTSSRIETLASRTRRLITNNIQPLEQIRTELVYKLTELELQIQPFQKQMNQSLSHLKTIQYYIDNQGSVIAGKKVRDYTKRLTEYLEQYRGHVLDQVERHVAPCGPVWDIYNAGRALICQHYIDSLNGFWLALGSMLLLWMVMTPLALKLKHSFTAVKNHRSGILLRTISHQCPPQDNWR